MSELFVDAHVHLWDLNDPELGDYGWLLAAEDPMLGPLREIQLPLWDVARFRRECRHTSPTKVVHIQAAGAPADPTAETAWLSAQHAELGWPHAIIARVDLRAGDAAEVVDRHLAASSLVRGARDMSLFAQFEDPAIAPGLAALAAAGLSWELACTWEDMPAATGLIDIVPDLVVVLGHAGFPAQRDADYLASWRSALAELAKRPNVSCKISGLGMGDHDWTLSSLRPLLEHCLTVFGPQRCLFGSNWPVDRLYGSYDATIGALLDLTGELSVDERSAVRCGTAERIYGI